MLRDANYPAQWMPGTGSKQRRTYISADGKVEMKVQHGSLTLTNLAYLEAAKSAAANWQAEKDRKAAEKAAAAHNQWDKRKHDVQAYPCFFCDHWHVGGIMTIEELKAVIATG